MRDDARRTPAAVMPDDEPPLDPAASAAVIAEQRAKVAAETDVDGRLLLGVWGLAWLIGFGALYTVAGSPPVLDWSPTAAGIVFVGLLVSAMVITAVHIARRTAGVHGTSAVQGAMYGWAWFLGFVAVFALPSALGRAGADDSVVQVAMTLVPPLLVGVLYMAGAAIWRDRTQFVLGVWILAATIAASFVGTPGMLAVMAFAGGGGMLVGALAEALWRRGRS
jgi:hypothetical protein